MENIWKGYIPYKNEFNKERLWDNLSSILEEDKLEKRVRQTNIDLIEYAIKDLPEEVLSYVFIHTYKYHDYSDIMLSTIDKNSLKNIRSGDWELGDEDDYSGLYVREDGEIVVTCSEIYGQSTYGIYHDAVAKFGKVIKDYEYDKD